MWSETTVFNRKTAIFHVGLRCLSNRVLTFACSAERWQRIAQQSANHTIAKPSDI